MLILTLSTIPPRFGDLYGALERLKRQTVQPDRIIVYVPRRYRRFPDYAGDLPRVPEGVEIRQPDHDYGPASKILHAAEEFCGQDVDLLFCDDDVVYPPTWIEAFRRERRRQPDAAIAVLGFEATRLGEATMQRKHQPRAANHWRITDVEFQVRALWYDFRTRYFSRPALRPARRMFLRSGYRDIFEGVGGVLVKPDHFDDTAHDIPDVMWTVDDVWLSGMLARRDIPIWVMAHRYTQVPVKTAGISALAESVIDGAGRHDANKICFDYLRQKYGIWH